MQVLQDRVIADSLLVCLWQQEKLPTVVAESSFHRALQKHCRPPGPLLTASLGGWSQDGDTEGRELTASMKAPKSQLTAEQPLTKITETYQKRYPTAKDKEATRRRQEVCN